jgi:hypothetical protein
VVERLVEVFKRMGWREWKRLSWALPMITGLSKSNLHGS